MPSIDEEHKIVETVRGLKDYTTCHFATEERHMSRLKFPALASHQAEHQLFVKTVDDYQRKLDDGKFVVTVEITNFIKDWIKNHILGTDKKYSGFLVSHGVR